MLLAGSGDTSDTTRVEVGSALPEMSVEAGEADQVRDTSSSQSPLPGPSSVDISSAASPLFIDLEFEVPDSDPRPPPQ